MWKRNSLLTSLILAVTLSCSTLHASATEQVLATVGSQDIHSSDLEAALASSPFYTQFNTMNEDAQASLRGDMLRRLVSARLMLLEARQQGLDKTEAFRQELADFRMGMLYRSYIDKLRTGIMIPADTLDAMKKQYESDAGALEAAKASFVATRFQSVKREAEQKLMQDAKIQFYEARIKKGIKPETVLMEGANVRIVYGDIVPPAMRKKLPNPEWIKQQLHDRADTMLAAQVAEQEGVEVSAQVNRYADEKLPALLLEQKAREWVPNEKAMRDWYAQHPEIGRIPAAYHVGQLVVASKEEADALRARILKGESLFNLAGEHSIDPTGRQRNGDLGWIVEGRGMPELIKVLPKLKDEELSQVIQTTAGYNLLMVLERRISSQKAYEDVRDRVRQTMVNQNLPAYLGELEKRYGVTWGVMAAPAAASQPVAAQ